jgi:hypothetical protein
MQRCCPHHHGTRHAEADDAEPDRSAACHRAGFAASPAA